MNSNLESESFGPTFAIKDFDQNVRDFAIEAHARGEVLLYVALNLEHHAAVSLETRKKYGVGANKHGNTLLSTITTSIGTVKLLPSLIDFEAFCTVNSENNKLGKIYKLTITD